MTNTGIDQKTREKIVAIINAVLPDAAIYLFGSRARGTHAQWSDIDLALDAGKPLNDRDVGEVNALMEALSTPYKVSVVDFYQVSEAMRDEIRRDKVVWKG